MSWADRFEKIISEKGPTAEVSKVSKAPKPDFRHFRHPVRGVFSENTSGPARRFAYRFRLRNGDGGTYLTDQADLDKARAILVKRYGDRLMLVVKA